MAGSSKHKDAHISPHNDKIYIITVNFQKAQNNVGGEPFWPAINLLLTCY